MKKILVLIMLLSVLLLVVSCSSVKTTEELSGSKVAEEVSSGVIASSNTVVIENGKFMPTDLEIKVGGTVSWVNKDTVAHTVTLENGMVDEKLPAGGLVSYTFNEIGEYTYSCSIHPGMQGKIIVN